MFPFLVYLLLRFCSFFRVFNSAHNSLNLDLCQRTSEAAVKAELVIGSNISGFRILRQYLELCASQRLQTTKEVGIRYLSRSFDVLRNIEY